MEKVLSFINALIPLLESKAFSLLLALAFAGFIAYACHNAIERQRVTASDAYSKLIAQYESQVALARECAAVQQK